MSRFKAESELRGDTEIVITRQFAAPQSLVFQCMTDPAILPKWLCPPGGKSVHCEIDPKIGGVWRHKIEHGEGELFDSFGQTLDFDAPNRYVRSDVINVPVVRESISTETANFSEADGVTTVEMVIRHMNKEERDSAASMGAAEGIGWSFQALDEILESMLVSE